MGRKEYGYDRTAPAFAIRTPHADGAFVFRDDALQNPKPKSGPLLGLCSEERLEDHGAIAPGDAMSGVGNREAHAFSISFSAMMNPVEGLMD
jgi:hypothetical protein